MRKFWVLSFCCVLMSLPGWAQNGSISGKDLGRGDAGTTMPSHQVSLAGDPAPVEISLSYDVVHTNANPAQCGCFFMNGGSTEVAFHVYRWFSAVADLTGGRAARVNGGPQGLSLVAFTAGPRFTYPVKTRYAPFVQALFGAAHGFDSYFPVASGSTGAANSFALLLGGGLDIRMKPYLAIRPVQADYLLTQLPNGINDRQNSLRLGAGLVFRFW